MFCKLVKKKKNPRNCVLILFLNLGKRNNGYRIFKKYEISRITGAYIFRFAKIWAFIGFGEKNEEKRKKRRKGRVEGREKGRVKRRGKGKEKGKRKWKGKRMGKRKGKGRGREKRREIRREKGREKENGRENWSKKGEEGREKGKTEGKREGKTEVKKGKREKRTGDKKKNHTYKKHSKNKCQKCLKNLEVDLFRTPKRSIILIKQQFSLQRASDTCKMWFWKGEKHESHS